MEMKSKNGGSRVGHFWFSSFLVLCGTMVIITIFAFPSLAIRRNFFAAYVPLASAGVLILASLRVALQESERRIVLKDGARVVLYVLFCLAYAYGVAHIGVLSSTFVFLLISMFWVFQSKLDGILCFRLLVMSAFLAFVMYLVFVYFIGIFIPDAIFI